jgi:hypothetical protein
MSCFSLDHGNPLGDTRVGTELFEFEKILIAIGERAGCGRAWLSAERISHGCSSLFDGNGGTLPQTGNHVTYLL